MFYRLRRRDGSTDPHSAGTIVLRDGTPVALAASAGPATTGSMAARAKTD